MVATYPAAPLPYQPPTERPGEPGRLRRAAPDEPREDRLAGADQARRRPSGAAVTGAGARDRGTHARRDRRATGGTGGPRRAGPPADRRVRFGRHEAARLRGRGRGARRPVHDLPAAAPARRPCLDQPARAQGLRHDRRHQRRPTAGRPDPVPARPRPVRGRDPHRKPLQRRRPAHRPALAGVRPAGRGGDRHSQHAVVPALLRGRRLRRPDGRAEPLRRQAAGVRRGRRDHARRWSPRTARSRSPRPSSAAGPTA